ncbi:MAG: arginine deiminase family protein [Conexivisphaerales archaeon]
MGPRARARAEWERLRTVMVHTPGIEMRLGLLAPYASLYERAFSGSDAVLEHERLKYILEREFGVEVLTFRDSLLKATKSDDKKRKELINLAMNYISFRGSREEAVHAKEQLINNSDSYDDEHYFAILLLNPLIDLSKGKGARAVYVDITARQPLSNLYFMRDQQAITDKGIFVGRMSKPQRRRECTVTSFAWKAIGLNLLHETAEPGRFEGGDFMPMKDFALVGVGDRTNEEGVKQLLKYGVEFEEVAVVHQPRHPLMGQQDKMVSMHLDTYFNCISSGLVVGNELLLRNAQVEVYERTEKGNYKRKKEPSIRNLFDYIKSKKFDIIRINTLEQMCYASNFLCIRENVILAVETDRIVKKVLANLKAIAQRNPAKYGRLLSQAEKDYSDLKSSGGFFPHKKEIYEYGVDAYPITLTNLTGGYGGAHCMTCNLVRG